MHAAFPTRKSLGLPPAIIKVRVRVRVRVRVMMHNK